LFSKPVRAYSHGCMRVENPDKYAETLLSISQPEEGFTVQRIRSLYGRGERDVNLKNPIPVYLTYQTVFFDQAGQVQTRPDIYGLDKNVTALLRVETAVAHMPVAGNHAGDRPVRARASPRPTYEVVEQPYNRDRTRDPSFRGSSSSARVNSPSGRVSPRCESIYFDLKSPDLQQVLEKIGSSPDIAATLDSFNPQQPQYKELKAALARARFCKHAVFWPRLHPMTFVH
jgi:murein L,D-transpeptidase YcbB/YkuD